MWPLVTATLDLGRGGRVRSRAARTQPAPAVQGTGVGSAAWHGARRHAMFEMTTTTVAGHQATVLVLLKPLSLTLSRAARRHPTFWLRAPRSLQALRETLSNQNPTNWHGPATQPLAVGDVTGNGATPCTQAPQAITWRGAPPRLRASPAGTRHRRPCPHPTVLAAPGALAHPGSAHRDSPRGAGVVISK